MPKEFRRCLFNLAVVAALFSLAKASLVGLVDGLIIGCGGYER